MKESVIEKLKSAFGVKSITIEEWRDKYGKGLYIKELGISGYKNGFEKHIDDYIEEYNYANSKEALKKLREVARKDNHYARFMNKREYSVVKVYTAVEPFMGFGALIKFKDNGELRYVFTTDLCYNLSGRSKKYDNGKWHYGSSSGRYFTAGGLRDKEVDFIFNGVGHSSQSDMYSRTCEAILAN